jgi:hypothetical protein
MAGITHKFVSAKDDGADETVVRPSNWNDTHDVEQVITDNAVVTVDDASVADNEFAKFTANGIEGRTYAEVLSDLGLPASPSGVEDKFTEIISWTVLGGFNLSSPTPPVAQCPLLSVGSGATSGNTSYMVSKNSYQNFLVAGKVITVEWMLFYVASVTACNDYIYMTAIWNHTPATAETSQHFGFRIVDGLVYATNAESSETAESTGVTLSTGAQFTRLKAVFTVGTDIKYYVDGVLKNTITTNLPSTNNSQYIYYAIKTTAAGAKNNFWGRFQITRTY